MPRPRTPRQDRSRATLDRIVDSASRQIGDHGFAGASIRRICADAGVSTGAFYARFDRKEELALPLVDRLTPDFERVADNFVQRVGAEGLAVAVRSLLEETIDVYRRHGGLLRALTAEASRSRELAGAMRQLNDRLVHQLVEAALERPIGRPRPALAIRLGLVCVLQPLKEIVLDQQLFDEPYPFDDGLLVGELTEVFLAYVAPRTD